MILDFVYGIEYKGFIYGWNKRELYRLPSESGNRSYRLKKLNTIMVGNQIGYHLKRTKFSIKQLKSMTILIPKVSINIFSSNDLPY